MRAHPSFSLTATALLLAVTACATPAEPAPTQEPDASQDHAGGTAPTKDGKAASGDSTAPPGAKVLCHLDCSGNEAKGYGVDEAAARADVTQHVEKLCAPEDGQYFIFCEPLS